MLLLSNVAWGADQPSVSAVPLLPDTTRGQTVTVQGNYFPATGVVVHMRTGKENPGDKFLSPHPLSEGDLFDERRERPSTKGIWSTQLIASIRLA